MQLKFRVVPSELSLPAPLILVSEHALSTPLPPGLCQEGVPPPTGGPSKASQTPHSQQFSSREQGLGPHTPLRATLRPPYVAFSHGDP